MQTSVQSIALIGLGNPLMTDEGIGVRILAELNKSGEIPDDVELLDLGTAGFGVLHVMAGRRKVVFVDCAYMDERPGVLKRFTPDEVRTRKVQTRLSLHEGDLMHVLELAQRLGEYPQEVVLYGIEPAEVSPGDRLSPVLEQNIESYLRDIRYELVKGHPCPIQTNTSRNNEFGSAEASPSRQIIELSDHRLEGEPPGEPIPEVG